MPHPIDYRQLAALDAVMREQGFDKAARSLHITQSAVSQRLAQLEQQLGQRVLSRSQPMTLTPTGERLLRHARQVALLEAELEQALHTQSDSYLTLPVGVNNDTLATWFIGALAPLLAAESRLLLHVHVDDQTRTFDMMRSGSVIGCVSSQRATLAGAEAVPLGAMRYSCAATPDFVARHLPHGLTADALPRTPAVLFFHDDPLHYQFLAQYFPGFDSPFPFHLIPSSHEFVNVVRAGAGFGLMPEIQIAGPLARGELVDLTPGAPLDMPLYWHHWTLESPLAVRLSNTLQDGARRLLRPPSPNPA